MSMVLQDDDASNSGLLDLAPQLAPVHTPRRDAAAVRGPSGMHTPTLGAQDAARMPPPLLGKGRARKVSRSDAPKYAMRARRFSGDVSSDASSQSSVIVHDVPSGALGAPPSQDAPAAAAPSAAPPSPAADTPMVSTLPGRLRRWMHDAMQQHLYETAIFWGQQVVALERT